MPNQYSVSDLLSIFENVYETIDVRLAVIHENQQWLLVALSLHLRVVSATTAEREFQDTAKRFGLIDSANFRIIQRCFPLREINNLAQMLLLGTLKLDEVEVQLSDKFDIMSLLGSVRAYPEYVAAKGWPRMEQQRQLSRDTAVQQALYNDPRILRDTELAGYETPHAAAKNLLGIDFSSSSNLGCLWISSDIPVRLLRSTAVREGTQICLSLQAEAHPAIKDVSCTVRRTTTNNELLLQQSVVMLRHSSDTPSVKLWSGNINLALERNEWITLEILYSKAGRLFSNHERQCDLLPSEQANPLLNALALFCPPDQFDTLLIDPSKAAVKDVSQLKNPGRLFEVSIQWLLSVLRFQSIWLHGYERYKDGHIDCGTIDCLAYSEHENLLLLVNCTIGAPDPTEMRRQAELRTRLSKQVFADSLVHTSAILFTTSHRPENLRQNGNNEPVKVFYREDIEELLRRSKTGGTFDYRTFTNRIFS